MGTIKFRGRRIDEPHQWEYGYIQVDGKDVWMHTIDGRVMLAIPETVGQFTGLTDKDGKEIYEGDIVSHPWKDPIFGDLVETGQFVHSTICFNNGAFVVNYRLQGEYIYLQDFVRLKCLEVVGNIHDNPELLGEK